MKAIVWTKYGPPEVLQVRDIEKPSPRDNEVLVRIRATTITAGDCEMRNLKFPAWIGIPMRLYVGLGKPKRVTILGGYLAGEIVELGATVRKFTVGDQIFASTGLSLGGYAEYVCLPEDGILAVKPSTMTFEEAAPVALGGLEALHFLRKADLQPGQTILINGAGGSIGTYAVQLARLYGAEVTAVDSTGKLDMLRSIGADHVIDYTREDFTRNGQTYDVIFDVVLNSPFSRIIRCLNQNGIYLMTNPTLSKMVRGAWVSRTTGKKVIFQFTSPNTGDLIHLRELIEEGKVRTIIDRQYSLEQAVEAHRYIESGQKKGNVVMTIGHDAK
jgi:NADPH:quinone reductase-like Zn-dependent oxidoreductase